MTVGPEDPDQTGRPDRPAPSGAEVPATSGADVPATRASDDERHRVVELLGEHAGAGRITLAELEDRVGGAYAATTRGDLAVLTADLPALDEQSAPVEPETTRRKRTRWFFAIMGGSTRRGRRRLAGRINVVAIMGGDELDLREAEIEGGELVVNVFAIMGGPDIYLPDSVELEMSGTAIMGGNDERGSGREPRPGAPVIRVRSFAIMGGTDVWRMPPDTRGQSLKAARRTTKARERRSG